MWTQNLQQESKFLFKECRATMFEAVGTHIHSLNQGFVVTNNYNLIENFICVSTDLKVLQVT